jgi:hypothetical protein
LAADYGKGYTYDNLTRMVRLAELFPDREILTTLSAKVGWSHFVLLLPIKDPLKRDFYAEMCRVERWSVRALREKINGMLFDRTALSRKPAELARQELAKLRTAEQLSPDLVFRDPYFLDFLGLKDTYSEKEVKRAGCGRNGRGPGEAPLAGAAVSSGGPAHQSLPRVSPLLGVAAA